MMASAPRYVVGIDLGTTHTVVAYADGAAGDGVIEQFFIEQLVAPGEVAPRPLLPSMRYHPAAGELAATDTRLPWATTGGGEALPEAILGELARVLGTQVPGRLVASAKSWLCHSAVDRAAPILPWGAAQDVTRISPVDASTSYLAYVRAAWDHRFPDHLLAHQDIILTVPASFDEVARGLTVEAARHAGLPRVHLVEEPQAACYDFLARHHAVLRDALRGVRLLLVCDVGGGTTDLTLIQVAWEGGDPRLTRIGVGDHLMLGGDNMDLALAHLAEARLMASGSRLTAAQLSQLAQQCRGAKERLLVRDAPASAAVTVLGAGARLVGGARSTELARDEVQQLVVDGFFPRVAIDERPHGRHGGIVEFGLPYAADPAVTRHLAAFLALHDHAARAALGKGAPSPDQPALPDALLLNGGVFRSASLRERLLQVVAQWRGAPPLLLPNADPDLAVARGAVAYGMARRGAGPRIGGGAARSFVLLVEDQGTGQGRRRGVCLLPRGTEEGREIRLQERELSLKLGQPVRFHLLASRGDWTCSPGELVDVDDERFRALPPIATVLTDRCSTAAPGREVPVQLTAVLTEVGTLEMFCAATGEPPADAPARWRLEFQLRPQKPGKVVIDTVELPARFAEAAARLERVFGPRARDVGPREVKTFLADLEKILGRRGDWDTPLLRELFGVLWDDARRRRRSPDHERLWLNLTGYCLRPGYGHPLDDWRVEQLWSVYGQGLQYPGQPRNHSEWWTLWRRVAGGLDTRRQMQLAADVADYLETPRGERRGARARKPASDDVVRLVASLERLPAARKTALGRWLIARLRRPGESAQGWWAVGRLGARVPFYGSTHEVVPKEEAMDWLETLLTLNWREVSSAAFAAAQLARLSGDRERDLDAPARERVAQGLRLARAPAQWVRMVEEITELDSVEQQRIFGESLPPGLRLVR